MAGPSELNDDMLMDYALGTLSEAETARVDALLADHPERSAELEGYLNGLSDMVMQAGPAPVPAGAADRLLARLALEEAPVIRPAGEGTPPVRQSAAGPRWLLPLLALAAAVALMAVILPSLTGNPGGELARYQRQPGAVTSAVQGPGGRTLAQVVRLKDGRAYVQMAAGPPAGRTYQAWTVSGGKATSAGLFQGQGFVAALPPKTVFAVSVEPEGGSPQPTTKPLFAQSI